MKRTRKKSDLFADRLYVCAHYDGKEVHQHNIYAFKISIVNDSIVMQNNNEVIVAIFPVQNTSIIYLEDPF